ncbi:alpha/beta hydrolase family protein [Bacteroidota bacterium]
MKICFRQVRSFSYLLLAGFIFSVDFSFCQSIDPDVLKGWRMYSNSENTLYHHLTNQAIDLWDKREMEVSQLTSKSDWLKRQNEVREVLLKIAGPFPEKTPLNPRITGVIQKDGYSIEKIIFESRPGFFVTGILFIPGNLKGKAPAILYCAGHSSTRQAFRSPVYQRVCINFAKKGFIVFAYDPVDQGERHQYFDESLGGNFLGRPTIKHSYSGNQCFITGSSQAHYVIWDGIRAIDYLISRKEVDSDRIGVTGQSGGGTQSAYIGAFDDRVAVAAPNCWITSRRRLWESIGPQDAEQNLYREIISGLDLADLLEIRAPKPTLVMTTTRDFFSIQGAREVEQEAKRAFAAFEKEENFQWVEDDFPHTVTEKNAASRISFFQKHLDLPGDSIYYEVEILSPKELRVSETGNLLTSPGLNGETTFKLNKKRTEELYKKIQFSRSDLPSHLNNVVKLAGNLSGYSKPDQKIDPVFTGRYQEKGYCVEKYFIQGEGQYPIPFLLFVPDNNGSKSPIIYLHPEGKNHQTGPDEEIRWLVQQGHIVLTPDLLGIGEMGSNFEYTDYVNSKLGLVSARYWYQAVMLGRSITGIHAGDINRLVEFLKQEDRVKSNDIYAIARGLLCPALIHAAAFNKSISRIALVESIISYRSLVMNQYYDTKNIFSAVPGALAGYDLPDLCASLSPRKLLMVNVADHFGSRADNKLIEEELSIVKTSYSKMNADNLEITNYEWMNLTGDIYLNWLQ